MHTAILTDKIITNTLPRVTVFRHDACHDPTRGQGVDQNVVKLIDITSDFTGAEFHI